MTDIFDRAQALELEDWQRNQARAIMPTPVNKSATVCECGERIPAARRKAVPGVQTCIECQVRNEMKRG